MHAIENDELFTDIDISIKNTVMTFVVMETRH